MRRERLAARIWPVLLVALASLFYAVGEPAFGAGAVGSTTLPRCSPDGYGVAMSTPRPSDGQKAVVLTAGWVTGPDRRRSCRVQTTIRLAITGSAGVAVSAQWSVSAVLRPWSAVVHTWVWRNWCAVSPVEATVKFSVPSGKSVHKKAAPPTCENAGAPSTVVDLGTGTRYVPRPGGPIPAQILPKTVPPPISPAVIRVKNAWIVSNGYNLVAVYAGTAGNDPSVGRFAIVRQNLIFGLQYNPPDIVNIGKAGALKITGAPQGASRETSAQHGRIVFASARGVKGVLRLTGDQVRIVRR